MQALTHLGAWLKNNYNWLLILACLPLFASKNLFNLPIAIMAVIAIVRLVRSPREVLSDPIVRLVIALFACFWLPMLASLTDAVNLDRTSGTVAGAIRFLFAGIFVVQEMRDARVRRLLFFGAAGFVAFWSLDGMAQFFFGRDLLGYPYNGQQVNGIFWPKLRLGLMTATMSPLVLEVIRLYGSRHKVLWLLIPVMLAVIMLSGNRNSWVMLSVAVSAYVMYLFFVVNRRYWMGVVGGGVVAMVLVLTAALQYAPFKDRMDQTLGLFSGEYARIDLATSYRLSLWKTASNMYQEHWINGVGPRGYRYVYRDYAEADDYWLEAMKSKGTEHPQTHPHQMALEVMSETGTIGLLGYIGMYVLLFAALWRLPREHLPKVMPWMLVALVAWFPANVHLALYASYWSTVAWWVLLLAVGSLQVAHTVTRRS